MEIGVSFIFDVCAACRYTGEGPQEEERDYMYPKKNGFPKLNPDLYLSEDRISPAKKASSHVVTVETPIHQPVRRTSYKKGVGISSVREALLKQEGRVKKVMVRQEDMRQALGKVPYTHTHILTFLW